MQSLQQSLKCEDEDEVGEENGVLFWVNKSGFPIDEKTWERMWNHVSKIHPGGMDMVYDIKSKLVLPEVASAPAPMNLPASISVSEKMEVIQKYMSQLQYNHTGTQFFEIRKNRPISGLMESARDMIKESLPIKCLEAVILGIYLTNGIPGTERFPISFKTSFMGNIHRHVVLGVYNGGRYGALGMSRRDDLMNKPLIYKSLSELIVDYEDSYTKYWHEIKKVKIGLPVSHDPHSYEHIEWRHLSLNVPKLSREEMCKELDRHAREMRVRSKVPAGGVPISPTKVSTQPSIAGIKKNTSNKKKHSKSANEKSSPNKQNKDVTLQQNKDVTLQQNKDVTLQQNKDVTLQQNKDVTLQQNKESNHLMNSSQVNDNEPSSKDKGAHNTITNNLDETDSAKSNNESQGNVNTDTSNNGILETPIQGSGEERTTNSHVYQIRM